MVTSRPPTWRRGLAGHRTPSARRPSQCALRPRAGHPPPVDPRRPRPVAALLTTVSRPAIARIIDGLTLPDLGTLARLEAGLAIGI